MRSACLLKFSADRKGLHFLQLSILDIQELKVSRCQLKNTNKNTGVAAGVFVMAMLNAGPLTC
jgi:hypothetical protein